jgi:hypothetical protein
MVWAIDVALGRRRCRSDLPSTASLGSVGTTAVVDADNDDLVPVVVDAVQDPVGAAPRGVDSSEVSAQRLPTRRGFWIREPVRNSMTAAATGSGSLVCRARTAGGVKMSS